MGYNGGEVVFSGPLKALLKEKKPDGRLPHGPAQNRGARQPARLGNSITVKGARENNLKNIDVRIPLGVMTCITRA